MSDKDLSGVLFKNDRKTIPNHPDRKGQCVIGGKSYWIAGWLKEKNGQQYLSLAFTAKDEKPEAKPDRPTNNARTRAEDIESDIPW